MIDRASETMRVPWNDIWGMSVISWLNVICYSIDKGEEQKRQIEAWKHKN